MYVPLSIMTSVLTVSPYIQVLALKSIPTVLTKAEVKLSSAYLKINNKYTLNIYKYILNISIHKYKIGQYVFNFLFKSPYEGQGGFTPRPMNPPHPYLLYNVFCTELRSVQLRRLLGESIPSLDTRVQNEIYCVRLAGFLNFDPVCRPSQP